MTGVTINTWIVDVIIPPMMGAAIGFMMSDPTPELHKIGSNPAMTTVTVINFGRRRSTDPSTVACSTSYAVMGPPCRSRRSSASCRYTTMTTPVCTATPYSAMYPTQTATEKL